MRLRVRLGLGFGVVLIIMVGLGLTSYLMFQNAAHEVSELNGFRLQVAQHATAVERLVLEALNQQKEYFVSRTPESQNAVRQCIADLSAKLKTIGEVAGSHQDQDMAAAAAEAEQNAAAYSDWFSRGVTAVQKSREEEARMEAKGTSGDREAATLASRKKAEYAEARDALAIANNINALALEMRFHEKSYMLDHDPQHMAAIQRNTDSIQQACDGLDKLHPNDDEKKQITLARTQSGQYLKSAEAWVAEQKRDAKSAKLTELAKAMTRSGDSVSQAVDDYTTCKQSAVEKTADCMSAMRDIGDAAKNARLNQKAYVASRDRKDWAAMQTHLAALGPLFANFKKAADRPEDRTQIENTARATSDYQTAADAWFKSDTELRDQVFPKLREAGEHVVTTARGLQQSAWKASDEVSDGVLKATGRSTSVIVICLLLGIASGGTLAVLITNSISRPLRAAVEMLKDIAQGEGDLTQRLKFNSRDEIGDLAHWFNTFVEKLQTVIVRVSQNTNALSASSQELSSTATQLTHGAEQTTTQSTAAAAAVEEMSANMRAMAASSEQLSTNVKTVASAVEQMTASISEVARNAEQAAHVAENAAQLAGESHQTISELGQSADAIGKVTETIQDIAEQTNLLALNATIEAARAGDAGKGFAVVATEVKELAKQTAAATEDIRKRIEGIQTTTGKAVRSIDQVGEVIRRVNDVSRTIASAVEEQSITTKEIAKNVAQTSSAVETVARGVVESATASQEISRNVVGVDEAAKQSLTGAAHTMEAGTTLANLANQLQTLVGQFKVNESDATAA